MSPRQLWRLCRPPTLPASIVPVCVGAAAGALLRPPSLALTLLMFAVGLLLQIATNIANEYFDFRRGVDRPGAVGIAGVLISGELDPAAVGRTAIAAYGLALMLGLVLVWARGWVMLALGLAAIAVGVLYSGGPRPIAATPFGEPVVFLLMGPVQVLASELAAVGAITPAGLAASVPVGFTVAAILMANNLRDVVTDAERGRRTLAVTLGAPRARRVLTALLVAPFPWCVVCAAVGWLPWPAAAVGLALPLVATRRQWGVPVVARLHLVTGLLVAAGLVAGRM